MNIIKNIDLSFEDHADNVIFNICQGDDNDFIIRQIDKEQDTATNVFIKNKGAMKFLIRAIEKYLEVHDDKGC